MNLLTFKYSQLKTIATIAAFIVITSCANQDLKDSSSSSTASGYPKETDLITDQKFSAETLYALLVAEVAIDRERFDIALQNYAIQAERTRDLNIVKRATIVSQALGAHEPTLEMASLWSEISPDNPQADQILASEYVYKGQLSKAFALSKTLLERGLDAPFDTIAIRAITQQKIRVAELEPEYAQLIKKHDSTALLLGHSYLLGHQQKWEPALRAVRAAEKKQPGELQIGIQEVFVLNEMGETEASLSRLSELVKENPKNMALRARYARKLADTDLAASQAEFEKLLIMAPNNADVRLSLALVAKQHNDLSAAEVHFKDLIAKNQHTSIAYYNLAKIAEKKNQPSIALEHYKQVEPGQQYVIASLSAARLIAKQDSEGAAIDFIETRKNTAPEEFKIELIMVQSDFLSRSGQTTAAEDVLTAGIIEFPNNVDLLYSRAMIYASLKHISAAESDLKIIITQDPSNASALNALGYTLADQTDRLQEAYDYISKAHNLNPDDPAILDSMGWVKFRLGQVEDAIPFLQKAMSIYPDHEIAAHLGEALWISGNQDQAIKAWQKGLELNPESPTIHSTLHRLDVSID